MPDKEAKDQAYRHQRAPVAELTTYARRYRLAKTCCMPLIYICVGLYDGLISPTMLDMKDLYGVNYETYSKGIMMKATGLLLGSFAGAVISDRYRKRMDWFLAISLFGLGGANAALPWLGYVALLDIIFFIQGIFCAVLNVVCSSTCISMWGERAPLPIHVLHAAFTFGQIMGPVVSQPFLQEHQHNTSNVSMTSETSSPPMSLVLSQREETHRLNLNNQLSYIDTRNMTNGTSQTGEVFIPFLITGAAGCVFSIAFFIFACVKVPSGLSLDTTNKSLKEMLSPGSIAGGRLFYGIFIVIGLFWVYVTDVIANVALNNYLFAVAVDGPLHFSKNEGSILNAVFYISSTAGRGIVGIIAHFLPIQLVLHVNIIIRVGAVAGLTFFGLTSHTILWILSCCAVFFASPTYPSVMAWSDRYIEVTGFIVCVIDTGIGAGAFVASWVSGVLFQRFGPHELFYLIFASTCTLWIVLIVMQIVSSIKGDRFKANNTENIANEEDGEPTETSPLIN